MVTTPLSEKKSSKQDVDEGTDEWEDIPLKEKKSSTKDVDKGTGELEDMKQAVVTILRKGLDQFDSQSKGYKGWFKLDSWFLKTTFLQVIQNSIRNLKIIILDIKTHTYIQYSLYCLMKNLSIQIMKENSKHDLSIRTTIAKRNRSAQTLNIYIFLYILLVLIKGRSMFSRRNKSKCNARKTHSKE